MLAPTGPLSIPPSLPPVVSRSGLLACLLFTLSGCGRPAAVAPAAAAAAPASPRTPAASAPPPATAASPRDALALPLRTGAVWTYRGTTKRGEDDRVTTEDVTWTTRVLEVVQRGAWSAAVMEGHPSDLVTWGAAPTPSSYVIVWRDGHYYQPSSPAPVLARLRDPLDKLDHLVAEADLLLRLPLRVGDAYCDEPPAEGNHYCWTVEPPHPWSRTSVTGAPPVAALGDRAFPVMLRTLPDHTVLTYVPGLGLLAYAYAHHGTPEEVELVLTSFAAGP